MSEGPWDVFLSYSRSASAEFAGRLRSALEEGGFTVFLDEREVSAGGPFPADLAAALLASRVVVVFATTAYFDSPWCVREYELAVTPMRYESGGGCDHIVMALPHEGRAERVLEHLPPEQARLAWPRADQTGELAALAADRLRAGALTIQQRLGSRAAGIARSLSEAGRIPAAGDLARTRGFLNDLPPSLKDRFVGRDRTLWAVFHLLETRRARGAPVACLAHGFGGIGKTQLAAEYVWRYGPSFYPGGIAWIAAGAGETRVQQGIQGALQVFGGVEGVRDAAREGAVLWVVDDIPVTAPVKSLDYWCPPRKYVTLLCTSRRPQVGDVDGAVLVDALSVAAAVDLLSAPPVGRSSLAPEEWEAIATRLGCLPLALRVLHASLAGGFAEAKEILARVQGQEPARAVDAEHEVLAGELPYDCIRGVAEAFHGSYEGLTAELKEALHVVARARGITGMVQNRVLAKLAQRGWLQPVGTEAEPNEQHRWTIHPVLQSYARAISSTSAWERALVAGWMLGLLWKRPPWMNPRRDRMIFYGEPRGGVDLLCGAGSQPLEEELRPLVRSGIEGQARGEAEVAATVLGALGDQATRGMILAALLQPATNAAGIDLMGRYASGASMQPPVPKELGREGGTLTVDAASLMPQADPELPQVLTILLAIVSRSSTDEPARRAAAAICSSNYGAEFLDNSVGELMKVAPAAHMVRLCTRIVEGVPEWNHAYCLRAAACEKAGQTEEAIRDYTRAIEKDRTYRLPLFRRGLLFASQDQSEAALRDFTALTALDPKSMQGHLQRAGCLLGLDRHAEALEALNTAIELDAGSALCWTTRAGVHLSLGDKASARRDAEHALGLDPGDAIAKQVLERCAEAE